MRIVILSQYFPPDLPGRIPIEVAAALDARGHDIRILTTFPHFVTGRIANGYKQELHYVEDYNGLKVRRVPIIPSHSSNPIGRIANYLSFAASARLAGGFVCDADVIYVHGTPATAAEPARAWEKSQGIPFVYHVQDIWPESVTESGFLPKPIATAAGKAVGKWLGSVYSRAAAVNAIAPSARRMLIERGVPEERCHLVFNWADEDSKIERTHTNGRGDNRTLTLLYAGNLGPFQDLETVIRAAHELRGYDGFRLLIAGGGVAEQQLKRLVSDLDAGRLIEFLGRVERDQMADLYASVDFQVVSLKDLEFFSGTIPSKFQAGLAHGLPLITTVKGDVTQLVREHGLGFSATPENVESLAAAFREAYETSPEERREYSRRARAFYDLHLSKEKAMDSIEAILISAAATRKA